MRLSFQTVLLVFAVTLAHLFAIAALSPVGGTTSEGYPGTSETSTIESTLFPPLPDERKVKEERPFASGDSAEPVDLPARPREEKPESPSAADDPVAESRSAAPGDPLPRRLEPLPRS